MTASTEQIEFCQSCAEAAHVRSDGRWSVGMNYWCPTCRARFTWHYKPDPVDPMVLSSICTTL